MSGAYTSKPDADSGLPEYPDIPLNWNPEWPFPGPNPPGYDPSEGMLVASSHAGINPGDSVSMYGRWEGQFGAPAGLPPGSWTQTWSAAIDGAPIGIREYGIGSFSSYLEYEFGTIGTSYYGVMDDIEFDIDDGDREKTITLTISSELGEDTASIYVKPAGNYLVVRVDTGSYPGETTQTMSCDPGTGVITSTDGVDGEVTIDTETLETLVGSSVSGTLDGTNLNGSFYNTITGSVSAYLYNHLDSILGLVEVNFSKDLPPGESGSTSGPVFMLVDVNTIIDIS